jgi:hypothetical protein
MRVQKKVELIDWSGVPLSVDGDGQVCAEHLPRQAQGAHHS